MTILVDGREAGSIPASDRALHYGDGVYRTLEWREGRARLWPWQWQRLSHDAAALGLDLPEPERILEELARAVGGLQRAVCKIILSRDGSRRGYAIAPDAATRRTISAVPWNGYPAAMSERGVAVRLCELRLGLQPRLAGIKHLNRLENVLARSEWTDADIAEGLLLDSEGTLVEGTMSNVFLVRDGELRTAALDRCGVAGAVRACLLAQDVVHVGRLTLADLEAADEAFLCNSLAGIWPIARFGAHCWREFPRAQALARALAAADDPAF
ncbi:aminodeoxychorismate lyase [Paludibacterium yongneupense]|uniref:aminodeoxychorismate lyase n=1 Tax=Paludibacterium yongneupense TaxID=400061 RepID=UPI000408801F|nr:aminodeoxychorismate lyase [Paludibacterium yongneupense]